MQINHLHGGELFDGAARREARRQGMEAPGECDMEAVGEEGDEDMRLDGRCILVKDRPDGEVAPCFRRGRLLRFLNASSTLTRLTRRLAAPPAARACCGRDFRRRAAVHGDAFSPQAASSQFAFLGGNRD